MDGLNLQAVKLHLDLYIYCSIIQWCMKMKSLESKLQFKNVINYDNYV